MHLKRLAQLALLSILLVSSAHAITLWSGPIPRAIGYDRVPDVMG